MWPATRPNGKYISSGNDDSIVQVIIVKFIILLRNNVYRHEGNVLKGSSQHKMLVQIVVPEIGFEPLFDLHEIIMIIHLLGDIDHEDLAPGAKRKIQQLRGQVAAAKKVGADVTQAFLVGNIRIDQYERDIKLLARRGKLNGFVNKRGRQQDPVRRV